MDWKFCPLNGGTQNRGFTVKPRDPGKAPPWPAPRAFFPQFSPPHLFQPHPWDGSCPASCPSTPASPSGLVPTQSLHQESGPYPSPSPLHLVPPTSRSPRGHAPWPNTTHGHGHGHAPWSLSGSHPWSRSSPTATPSVSGVSQSLVPTPETRLCSHTAHGSLPAPARLYHHFCPELPRFSLRDRKPAWSRQPETGSGGAGRRRGGRRGWPAGFTVRAPTALGGTAFTWCGWPRCQGRTR